MKTSNVYIAFLAVVLLFTSSVRGEVVIDGFLQGLYGGRVDKANPTIGEQTASESRLQMRFQHWGDNGNFFGRLDFVYDGVTDTYDWEVREAFFRFGIGSSLDFKVGRQILTWGTGDLVFINDVFAKDYQSFFIGRDDQYLKAPQNALRGAWYNPLGELSVVWSPRFEGNRLPEGTRLSYYNPLQDAIVGDKNSEYMAPVKPEAHFKNSELAARWQHRVSSFATAVYFYRGFYKNPNGFDMELGAPIYPRLHIYGASTRGPIGGGILWIEGGYYDSRDDQDGDLPMIPNSSLSTLIGFERQIVQNLTFNLQWQADVMMDYDIYQQQVSEQGGYVRDEVRHLLTTRWTKLLNSELVTLSAFVFYSPTDEDVYAKLSAEYKYTDQITLAAGANLFEGNHIQTDFGQFQRNDNVWAKMTYGFF
jgi:hypothetical protein